MFFFSKYILDDCTAPSDYLSSLLIATCLFSQSHDKELTKLRNEFEERVQGTVLIASVFDSP